MKKQLATTREGDELINKVYNRLFDRAAPILEKMLQQVVNEKIKSSKIKINKKDMECFCIFTFLGNIEEKLRRQDMLNKTLVTAFLKKGQRILYQGESAEVIRISPLLFIKTKNELFVGL